MKGTGFENLPQPTPDLGRARTDLGEFRYCMLAGALDPDEVSGLRMRLQQQAAAEKQEGLAFEDSAPDWDWGRFQASDGAFSPEP